MYDVDEILYLLSNKNNKIVPAKVESVVTIKRAGGSDITHEIKVPGHEEIIQLEKLNVRIFPNPNSLRKHLLKTLQAQVDEELGEITKIIKSTWGHSPAPASSQPEPTDDMHEDEEGNKENQIKQSFQELDEIVQIELENGMKARVHIPEELR